MNSFNFRRDLPEGKYKLTDIFSGLENAPELIEIFGKDIKKINAVALTITSTNRFGEKLEYAYIHEGGIHFGADYIRTGPDRYIYLDIIHELTHIKQLWNGMDLWNKTYAYVDRPTEIEAYKTAVQAAKRIGMNYPEISSYLEVPWASKEEMARLEKSLELK
jgi:hypothetical protein